jgi:hypothetical protein
MLKYFIISEYSSLSFDNLHDSGGGGGICSFQAEQGKMTSQKATASERQRRSGIMDRYQDSNDS